MKYVWHKYPEEKPQQDVYWVKLSDGNERVLQWDHVWGWCGDFDDYDRPHFVYDWDLEYRTMSDDEYESWLIIHEEL